MRTSFHFFFLSNWKISTFYFSLSYSDNYNDGFITSAILIALTCYKPNKLFWPLSWKMTSNLIVWGLTYLKRRFLKNTKNANNLSMFFQHDQNITRN
jgi:hypothetical protein